MSYNNQYNYKGGKQSKEAELASIENEFYNKVNTVISEKITPFYNTFLLLSGCFFTYYVLMGEQ